jgi:hypothetical protein
MANSNLTNAEKARAKSPVLVIATLGGIFFLIWHFITLNNIFALNNEWGLKQTLNRQYSLLNSKDGIRNIYRNFLSPELRTQTEDEYINSYEDDRKKRGFSYQKVEIHGISVRKNIAYVDRTFTECTDSQCNAIVGKHRSFKKYIYYNGKWLMSVGLYCPRDKMYSMAPEFERAINLIQQRTNNFYKDIINCVYVEYSKSDQEIEGAEGVFHFVEGQSPEKLDISVSPRYSIKDDLITAVLLIHEITHARLFSLDLLSGKPTDCFENEAKAFNNQNWFINLLNPEERASMDARLQIGASTELINIRDAYNMIPKYSGNTYMEKAINFVRDNPYYQKQCSGAMPDSDNPSTLPTLNPAKPIQTSTQAKADCVNRVFANAEICVTQCTRKAYDDLATCKTIYSVDVNGFTSCGNNVAAAQELCTQSCQGQAENKVLNCN